MLNLPVTVPRDANCEWLRIVIWEGLNDLGVGDPDGEAIICTILMVMVMVMVMVRDAKAGVVGSVGGERRTSWETMKGNDKTH
jgi:hypothetical protein